METMRHDMEAVALSLSRSIRHEGCVVLCDLVPAGEDPSKLSGHLHAAGFVAITCSDSSRIFLEHALSDLSRCKDLGLEAVEPRLADVVARLEAGDRLFVYQAERAGDTESSADDNESGTTVP